MAEARIGKIGKILSGDSEGFFVKVIDDTQDTGGYYVLLSDDSNFDTPGVGFDHWFETITVVKYYFSKLTVEWLDE